MLVALTWIVLLSACDKKDPIIPNEEEVITTLIYTLTPMGGGQEVIFSFSDLDGEGGSAPVISAGTLITSTTYTGSLDLLNEQEVPAGIITEEIEEEAEDHQFFFTSSTSNINVVYSDQDSNGNPIGLSTSLTTTTVGSGTLTITLRHEADKSASGVSDGVIANAGGETDIEVSFPIDVQ